MTMTPLPTPPSIADPEHFSEKADAFVAALVTFQAELNAIIGATIPAGSAAAGTLTGDTLPANVVNSSLTSVAGLLLAVGAILSKHSIPGFSVGMVLWNEDNTDPLSNATLQLQVGGASAGDPFIHFSNIVAGWYVGLDNSDADKFKIGYGGLTGAGIEITAAGDASVTGDLSAGGVFKTPASVTCTVVNTWYDVPGLPGNPAALVIARDTTSGGTAAFMVESGAATSIQNNIGNLEFRSLGSGAKAQVRVTGGTAPRVLTIAALRMTNG